MICLKEIKSIPTWNSMTMKSKRKINESYFVVVKNLDEVHQQHRLASVGELMDIRNNVVHPPVLTSAFEVQQQLEYSLFVLTVNLIKREHKKYNLFIKFPYN